MNGLIAIRVPLFLIGLALIFVSERYFAVYDYYKYAVLGAWIVCILPLLIALTAYKKAQAAGYKAEARSWLYLSLWQLTVVAGVGVFYVYKWKMAGATDPDQILTKILLAVWLSLLAVGFFTGIGLELAHRTNGQGENAEPNRLRWSGAGWLGIGLLFSGLFALNYGVINKDKVFDLSYFKTTRPGESTLKTAASVTEPIKIGMFFAKDSEVLPFVRIYVETVAKQSPQFELGIYDKDYFPLQAEEFRTSRNGTIVLQKGDQRQRIELGDQLEGARRKLKKLDVEFQKALVSLIEPPKVAYFTSTHGEMGWSNSSRSPLRSLKGFEAILRTQNISSRSLPQAFASIPEDAAFVAIVGPVGSLAAEEVGLIRAYLEKGGKVLVALDIESGGETPEGILSGDQKLLTDLLLEMGLAYQAIPLANDREYVNMGRDSQLNRLFLHSNVFGSHESVTTLTRNDDKLNVLFFQAGYFDIQTPQGDWKPVPTVLSTKNTFADKNKNMDFDASEVRNSYTVAAAVERGLADGKKAQVLAFSDATLLSDALMSYNGNQFIALDAIRWLGNRMETAGALESEEDVKIQHSKGRELFLFHGSIYLIPVLIIGLGFVVNRRKRVRA